MINLKGRFDFSLEFQIFLSNSRIFLFPLQPNTVTKRIFFFFLIISFTINELEFWYGE